LCHKHGYISTYTSAVYSVLRLKAIGPLNIPIMCKTARLNITGIGHREDTIFNIYFSQCTTFKEQSFQFFSTLATYSNFSAACNILLHIYHWSVLTKHRAWFVVSTCRSQNNTFSIVIKHNSVKNLRQI
jgi:hypothetical protein